MQDIIFECTDAQTFVRAENYEMLYAALFAMGSAISLNVHKKDLRETLNTTYAEFADGSDLAKMDVILNSCFPILNSSLAPLLNIIRNGREIAWIEHTDREQIAHAIAYAVATGLISDTKDWKATCELLIEAEDEPFIVRGADKVFPDVNFLHEKDGVRDPKIFAELTDEQQFRRCVRAIRKHALAPRILVSYAPQFRFGDGRDIFDLSPAPALKNNEAQKKLQKAKAA